MCFLNRGFKNQNAQIKCLKMFIPLVITKTINTNIYKMNKTGGCIVISEQL